MYQKNVRSRNRTPLAKQNAVFYLSKDVYIFVSCIESHLKHMNILSVETNVPFIL